MCKVYSECSSINFHCILLTQTELGSLRKLLLKKQASFTVQMGPNLASADPYIRDPYNENLDF